MGSEKRIRIEEAPSSAQLTAILVVSAAFVSTGILFSSKVMGLKFPQPNEPAVVARQEKKMNGAIDSEMRRKYRLAVSRDLRPIFQEAAPRLKPRPSFQ